MASAYNIKLSLEDTGVFKIKNQDEETAAKASELLQQNHEVYLAPSSRLSTARIFLRKLLTFYSETCPYYPIYQVPSPKLKYF